MSWIASLEKAEQKRKRGGQVTKKQERLLFKLLDHLPVPHTNEGLLEYRQRWLDQVRTWPLQLRMPWELKNEHKVF